MLRFLALLKDYPGLTLALSALGLLFVMLMALDQASQIRRSHEIDAEIIAYRIEYRRARGSGQRRVTGYYPVVSYALPNGQMYEKTAETKISARPVIGALITVYVDSKYPDLPSGVLVKDFNTLWGGYIFAGGIAVLAVIASAVFYFTSGKPRKPDPKTRDRLQAAIARYQAGDLRGAVHDLGLVIDDAPSGMAYEWRGDAHASLGDRAAAADYRGAVRMYRKENHEDNLRRAMGKVTQTTA
ncbi:MAG TPA: DUF3592 domain-containing protein [Herpetosiphonaceae bacterium]